MLLADSQVEQPLKFYAIQNSQKQRSARSTWFETNRISLLHKFNSISIETIWYARGELSTTHPPSPTYPTILESTNKLVLLHCSARTMAVNHCFVFFVWCWRFWMWIRSWPCQCFWPVAIKQWQRWWWWNEIREYLLGHDIVTLGIFPCINKLHSFHNSHGGGKLQRWQIAHLVCAVLSTQGTTCSHRNIHTWWSEA